MGLMTSKERVLTALARQRPDRVPINYMANPGIDARLKEHFGLAADDGEGLLQALRVDFRHVGVPYVGSKLHADPPGRQVDDWGIHRRWIEHESGGYWDYCDFPLREATVEQVAAWAMPSPDDYDYAHVAEHCRRNAEYCCVAGGPGTGDIINSTGMIRSMEQVLVDLMLDDAACLLYMDRRQEIMLQVLERTLEAAQGGVDLLWLGEDLGTQRGPLINQELFQRHILPRHKLFIDVGKAYDLPVMLHSCGSSSWSFDAFAAAGLDVVDTLQPEAENMSPAYLKAEFGDRLAFHGCISTAGPVAVGSMEETVANVHETLEIMMPGGGYAMSPTHQLQDNSPTRNVVAMYETTYELGRY
jgi:uroporphyrinogen decarboxylase